MSDGFAVGGCVLSMLKLMSMFTLTKAFFFNGRVNLRCFCILVLVTCVYVYMFRDINECVFVGFSVGDCVLMRPSDTGKPPYVARIEKIESDARNNVKVRVRWYYRPEESLGGRRQFHGAKELFLSDHYDVQSAHTIEGKCIVHSFKNYTKLENVGAEDYYCRFEYKAASGGFTPDRVAV